MKDVSCKVLPVILNGAERQNHSLNILLKDIPYDLKYLRNSKNYIEWDVFCRICQNSRAFWNDDDLVQLGKDGVNSKVVPLLNSFLSLFINPKAMYRMMFANKNGLNSQLFKSVTNTLNEIGKNKYQLIGEFNEGYQYSREFLLISKGTFVNLPLLIKFKPSDVQMIENEKGAIFTITYQDKPGLSTRLRQFIFMPFSRQHALRERQELYEHLYERYSQLEESKVQIQKQAEHEKRLLLELQHKQQLEIDLLNVRARISRDLHDELGSEFTKISLLSEVLKQDLNGSTGVQAQQISDLAHDALQKMGEIVWSLNPKNDFLDTFIAYLRKYAVELFEQCGIECIISTENNFPHSVLDGQWRRQVFLVFKEALNNILKHAQASKVELTFNLKNGSLLISIHDNGRGIDLSKEINGEVTGNGLHNMKQRMEQIEGAFGISNHQGTRIDLEIPFKQPDQESISP